MAAAAAAVAAKRRQEDFVLTIYDDEPQGDAGRAAPQKRAPAARREDDEADDEAREAALLRGELATGGGDEDERRGGAARAGERQGGRAGASGGAKAKEESEDDEDSEEELLMRGDQELLALAKTSVHARKRAKRKLRAASEDAGGSFVFEDTEGGAAGGQGPVNAWDFASARQAQRPRLGTTVQEKIESRKKRGAAVRAKSKLDGEESAGGPAAAAENGAATMEADVVEEEKGEDEDGDGDEDEGKDGARGNGDRGKAAKSAGPEKFVDFAGLGLSRPLVRAVQDLHYERPTPVQRSTIPVALTGCDVLVNAVTGSGKTAAFMLPILERLLFRPRRVAASRVLVLTPTRELAAQCHSMTQKLAKYTDVRVALIVGGLSLQSQEVTLRGRPDVLVCTPGRIIDHLRNSQSVHLEDVEVLVLDEADRLLERGFEEEIKEIVRQCPRGRQTLLFSATLGERVVALAKLSLNNPQRIVIDPMNSLVDTLSQEFVRVRPAMEGQREAIVVALCERSFTSRTIVFVRSKFAAHRLLIVFGLLGLKAAELHGNLTQLQRLEALERFRDGAADFLICTDLAARGLDIQGVQTVVNMNMPNSIEQYIHRVGRTARAGRTGVSVTLVGEADRKMLKDIVAKAKSAVRSRAVPHDVVQDAQERIAALEEDVKAVLREEREEKELRVAEMEANKARNLLEHEAEIHARPARTWFQNKQEKVQSKIKGLEQHLGGDEDALATLRERLVAAAEGRKAAKGAKGAKGAEAGGEEQEEDADAKRKRKQKEKDPFRGLSRRERRRKQARMEFERERERQREDAAKGGGGGDDGDGNDRLDDSKAAPAKPARPRKRPAAAEPDHGKRYASASLGDEAGADAFDRRYAERPSKRPCVEQPRHRGTVGKRFKSKSRYKRR